MEFTQIRKEINEKYIFVDRILDAFERAYEMKQNILLTGPRGHGKSELSKKILEMLFGETPFILPGGPGMRAEQVFGAFDMNEWRNNSVIRYMTEEGFMGRKSAIFEEFLDWNPQILEQLKDPIMRRELCNGNLCIKSMCEIIVACTNYNPKEWAERDGFCTESYEAMLDRFIYQVEVKWPSYEAASYQEMMMKQGIKGKWVKELAHTCEEFHKVGHTVTPRNCMIATKGYEKYGLAVFENFGRIPEGIFGGMKSNLERMKATVVAREILESNTEKLEALKRGFALGQVAKGEQVLGQMRQMAEIQNVLNNLRVTDETASEFQRARNLLDHVSKMATEALMRSSIPAAK